MHFIVPPLPPNAKKRLLLGHLARRTELWPFFWELPASSEKGGKQDGPNCAELGRYYNCSMNFIWIGLAQRDHYSVMTTKKAYRVCVFVCMCTCVCVCACPMYIGSFLYCICKLIMLCVRQMWSYTKLYRWVRLVMWILCCEQPSLDPSSYSLQVFNTTLLCVSLPRKWYFSSETSGNPHRQTVMPQRTASSTTPYGNLASRVAILLSRLYNFLIPYFAL